MKIKNTKELRLRAAAHARQDHIIQGTYGRGDVNGKVMYKGCAVACLSTPHRKRDIIRFIKEHFMLGYLGRPVDDMRVDMAREFGVNEALIITAEGFFEAQPTHGAAINFVRDFANALPEGANISPRQVRGYLKRTLGFRARYFDFQDVEGALEERQYNDWGETKPNGDEEVPAATKDFLNWLKAQPVSS